MRSRVALCGLGLLWLSACGKEAGRVPFAAADEQSAAFELKAGEVAFWTELDLEWEGDGGLVYTIDLSQGGKSVATASCNPLGHLPIKTGWVSTDIGAKHSRRGSGKMECTTKLAQGGSTTVKAKLQWGPKPATMGFRKADLVVKQ